MLKCFSTLERLSKGSEVRACVQPADRHGNHNINLSSYGRWLGDNPMSVGGAGPDSVRQGCLCHFQAGNNPTGNDQGLDGSTANDRCRSIEEPPSSLEPSVVLKLPYHLFLAFFNLFVVAILACSMKYLNITNDIKYS